MYYSCLIEALYFAVLCETREFQEKVEEMRLEVFHNVKMVPDSPKYRFDIWDFGGQHVYYTSHPTFLCKEAIYLVTMDMSLPLDEAMVTETQKVKRRWKDTGFPKTAEGKV